MYATRGNNQLRMVLLPNKIYRISCSNISHHALSACWFKMKLLLDTKQIVIDLQIAQILKSIFLLHKICFGNEAM